jgi:hypothetical protein
MIGFGPRRPVFLLVDNTPAYKSDLAYKFFFDRDRDFYER